MRFHTYLIATAFAAATAGAAVADSHIDPAIAGAIKARQGQMQLYAHNLGILGGMAKQEMAYDAAAAQAAADNLAAVSALNGMSMWPQGSDSGAAAGITRAKADIWSNFPDVGKKAGDMAAAAQAMQAAAGTDLAALQGAMKALGGACGACHKAYRESNN